MRLIDTHAHLYVEDFDADIDAVVARAQTNGVEKVLLPNINAESIAPMHHLCNRFPTFFYPMMGLHPTDVSADYNEVLDGMEQLFTDSHPYIAVGEVGLDYYWDRTFYEEQKVAFSRQIAWAVAHDLPLMIHSRSAHEELVEVLKNTEGGGHMGVFHCFSGSRDEAEELLGFDGYMLGIGGVLTYKKSTLPETLQEVPLKRIVIETDAPYLSPTPHRGKRNESAHLIHVVETLSRIYNKPVSEVAEVVHANALKVFSRVS